MSNINVGKGGGKHSVNSSRKRKEEGCMTFGKNKMFRECVPYYDEPTVENCIFFLGKDISEERYKEYLDFCE